MNQDPTQRPANPNARRGVRGAVALALAGAAGIAGLAAARSGDARPVSDRQPVPVTAAPSPTYAASTEAAPQTSVAEQVADDVPESEMIRLHVRSGVTAREDLELLLCPQTVDTRAQAALMFTCNGRGAKLFGSPNGDVGTMQEALGGAVPAAGMFCAGEIGPVGGRNYLHGHTASVVILRPR